MSDNCHNCKSDKLETRRVDDCRCHISPPCSACVDAPFFCLDCASEQEYEKPKPISYRGPIWDFKVKTIKDLDRTKLDYIAKSHTHFSMIKEGYCPAKMSIEELISKIKGTFGGKFESLSDGIKSGDGGYFKYIAYTD